MTKKTIITLVSVVAVASVGVLVYRFWNKPSGEEKTSNLAGNRYHLRKRFVKHVDTPETNVPKL
jgi:hypothetical protein